MSLDVCREHPLRTAYSEIYATLVRRVGISLTSSLRSAFHVSYAACMRTQTPAPSPNNLPSRTATAGDTGLRSMLAGDAEKSCNLGFCPAGGWNYILPQQGAGMGRATIRMPSGGVNHNNFLS